MKHLARCWIHLPGVVTRVAISGLLFRVITPGAMGKVCGISPFHLLGLPAPAPQLHVCVVGSKSDLGPVSSRCQVVLTGLTSMVSPFFPGQDSGRWSESCLLWTSWQKLPDLMLHKAQGCTCLWASRVLHLSYEQLVCSQRPVRQQRRWSTHSKGREHFVA